MQLLTSRGGKEAENQQREEKEREEASRVETPQSPTEEAVAKRPITEDSESEMDTVGRGKTSTSTESQFRCKKVHMTNIYLTEMRRASQEGMPVGEVCKQPQAVTEGVQDLVQIHKDSLYKIDTV